MFWLPARLLRLLHGLGPIGMGVITGLITTAAMFTTRLIDDDLAAYLFRLSHGG